MGDLKEAITLFDREKISIELSTEAGDLWAKDQTGIKVRDRFDVQAFDEEAVIKGRNHSSCCWLMAAGFRRGGKDMELEELKAYCRIDYDDDDEVIKLIYAAVLEEMTDLIKDFNPEALTNRQKLLICMYVKEAYDNRDRTAPTDDKVRFAVQSMMLKERLK